MTVAMHGENIRASGTFSHKKTMVKGIPIIGHEDPWGMWIQGCTYLCKVYTATALGKCRVASPMLGHLYPQYSYYSSIVSLC